MTEKDRTRACWGFANECRAFARLWRQGQNGTLAVGCHGWMKITPEQLHNIRRAINIYELTPWAIVKDLVNNDLTPEHIPAIINNLDIAYDALMVLNDTRPENYKGSILVDLGTTKIWPHPLWSQPEFARNREEKTRVVKNWKFVDGHFKG